VPKEWKPTGLKTSRQLSVFGTFLWFLYWFLFVLQLPLGLMIKFLVPSFGLSGLLP
jgi:hypothetical protein